MSDRGISDLVGFTLMFGIIIMSVAIVTTAGITQLSDLSEREGVNSAERGMEAFAGSADDLSRHGDVVRQAVLSPSGGLVWLNDTSLDLTVENAGGVVLSRTVSVNALEHRFSQNPEDVSVTFESGAVFRSDGGGAIVRPQWRCSADTAMVTAVRLAPGSDLSLGSGFGSDSGDPRPTSGDEVVQGDVESTDSGVRFQLTRTDSEVFTFDEATHGSMTVNVDPAEASNPEQWGIHLDRSDDWADAGSGRYECRNVDRVVVRIVRVDLSV